MEQGNDGNARNQGENEGNAGNQSGNVGIGVGIRGI